MIVIITFFIHQMFGHFIFIYIYRQKEWTNYWYFDIVIVFQIANYKYFSKKNYT